MVLLCTARAAYVGRLSLPDGRLNILHNIPRPPDAPQVESPRHFARTVAVDAITRMAVYLLGQLVLGCSKWAGKMVALSAAVYLLGGM